MKFVQATDDDKEYFANLSELVYRRMVEQQIGLWDSEKERAKFEEKWQEQSFKKVYVNGELIGGFWVQEFDDYYQLRELQIHPDYQNRGYGTELLTSLTDKANSTGKELRLRVLLGNPSVNLYKRLGFKVVGQTDVQYHMVYSS